MQQVKNIKSLQVFSAVARCLNLTHAAREMNVSQSSVSYHIKKIEDEIGAPLFDRHAEGVRLTERGAVLAAHVERGLSAFRIGLEEVGSGGRLVRLAVLPMFASRWLSARLGSFWEEHPGLELTFQNHNNNYVSMKSPGDFADLGVQWGCGGWLGFQALPLWTEKIVVVCSPKLLPRRSLRKHTDIHNLPLLHVDDNSMWGEWFANAGLDMRLNKRQTTLDDRHFQLASTINGLGVSLFAESMIAPELRSGILINPFGHSFPTRFTYHLVVPESAQLSSSAWAFRAWLLGECQKELDKSTEKAKG